MARRTLQRRPRQLGNALDLVLLPVDSVIMIVIL